MFRNRVRKAPTKYAAFGLDSLAKDQPIVMDGYIAGKMTDTVVRATASLFKFVEQWFTDHPVH